MVDRAIGGLDQTLTIITALLRIAEIEQGRRRAGFGEVALDAIVREVGELYEPIAEDKHLDLRGRGRRRRRRSAAIATCCSRRSPIWSTTP